MSLTGKTVLISGGVKNLGALVAREFASIGASNFVLHYHSQGDKVKGEALVEELGKKGAKVELFQGNLIDVSVNKQLFDFAVDKFGGIDIAVNCVGRLLKKPIAQISEQEYDDYMGANAKAPFFFVKEAGRTLNFGGKLIMVSTSILAAYVPMFSLYAGGKAATEQFVRAASKELKEKQISVNSIAPGPMDTPMLHDQEPPQAIAHLKGMSMNGELTKIEDIAPIIRFLGTEGYWFNGQCLFANGGFATR